MRFEVFTTVKIEDKAVWVVTLCNVVYHCFGGLRCLHLLCETNGTGKGSINIGRQYKRGWSLAAHRKPISLPLPSTVLFTQKMEASGSSETLISYGNTK
jgi:hypothetical protein